MALRTRSSCSRSTSTCVACQLGVQAGVTRRRYQPQTCASLLLLAARSNGPPSPLCALQRLHDAFREWYWWPLAAVNRAAVVSFWEADHMKLSRKPGQSLGDAVRGRWVGAPDVRPLPYVARWLEFVFVTWRRDGAERRDVRLRGSHRDAHAQATAPRASIVCPLQVRDVVHGATGARPAGRIQLITHPSYLGYCFNPVSFYYVWAPGGRTVETIVAEVSNTPWCVAAARRLRRLLHTRATARPRSADVCPRATPSTPHVSRRAQERDALLRAGWACAGRSRQYVVRRRRGSG